MNKAILFLLVLAACGGNPDAAIKMSDDPNGHVSVVGEDAGTQTAVDYIDGRDGKDGKDGAPGPQGAPGEIGPQGPQGVPGERGATGPQGPVGLTGATGPQGPQGLTGAQGLQGSKGSDGVKGDTGPQGVAGVAGVQGPQGPQGPQGTAGSAGADGAGGYWVDSTGARAPIVNIGGANTNATLYVHTDGVMYPIYPMTGRLYPTVAQDGLLTLYYENNNCTGRRWYRFPEMRFIAPMTAFIADGAGYTQHTFAFSRDVKIATNLPVTMRSYVMDKNGACVNTGVQTPPTVVTQNGVASYFYYVEQVYVIHPTEVQNITTPTVPPYRFVPNL